MPSSSESVEVLDSRTVSSAWRVLLSTCMEQESEVDAELSQEGVLFVNFPHTTPTF